MCSQRGRRILPRLDASGAMASARAAQTPLRAGKEPHIFLLPKFCSTKGSSSRQASSNIHGENSEKTQRVSLQSGSTVITERFSGVAKSGDSSVRMTQVRKRHFLRHLYIKINILPRQARDKHRENSKKDSVFSQCMRVLYSIQDAVSKNRLSFFIPNSHPKNDHFTETILPRQARDKHEGKHAKRGDHLLRSRISSGRRPSRAKRRQPGAKTPILRH